MPIKAVQEVTYITQLVKRRDAKALVQASKYHYLPDHPMKERQTKNRLKRSRYVHEIKILMNEYSAQLGQGTSRIIQTKKQRRRLYYRQKTLLKMY